jgi:predicted house-cleaning noncanonical NTP pyrophosphatase (MazG superfamily)
MKGIKEIIILKNKNDKIPEIINNAQRPAYIISEAETYDQALKIAQNGASKIKFQME